MAAHSRRCCFPRRRCSTSPRRPAQPFSPPSLEFPLGTDDSGRSVLALVVWGARISLLVGLAATRALDVHRHDRRHRVRPLPRAAFGGILDRVTDWFLVIPYLPLAIVLATVLGRSLFVIIVVIGVTSWPGTARLIRAQTLSVEGRPYLERSKALGAGNVHQMTRARAAERHAARARQHHARGLDLDPVGDHAVASSASATRPRCRGARSSSRRFSSGAISQGAWWYLGSPGVCVVLVVLAFNLIGRADRGHPRPA